MVNKLYSPSMLDVVDLSSHHHGCGCDCGQHSEHESAEAARFPEVCRKNILVYIAKEKWAGDRAMNMSFGTFKSLFIKAANDWNSVCGVKIKVTSSPELMDPAHVYVYPSHRFAGDVLADSHLADGTCGKHFRQRYDVRQWNNHLLYLTILHELGHLLGLKHKNGPYIMNPTILTRLEGLTSTDIARAVALYGPPLPTAPDPDPEPDPPSDPEPPPKEKDVDFFDLLMKLAPIILKCLEDDEAKTLKRIRDGRIGFTATLALARGARSEGIHGRANIRTYIADQRRAIATEASAMSDVELSGVLRSAAEIHQSLAS